MGTGFYIPDSIREREGLPLNRSSRGRLNQGTVLPNRGAVPELAARRRFGPNRGFEGRMEKLFGAECLEAVLKSSLGVHQFVKVMGIPAVVRDGWMMPQMSGGGFASLSDLISEATTGGKAQRFRITKTGVTAPAAGATQHLWGVGQLPAAGGNAAAAPGGTAFDRTSTGALGQANPTGGDTLHFVSAMPVASSPAALLMYDYLFGVNIAETATTTAVTGVPTRYATTTSPGNWISARVTTVHTATAGNYTITYMDDAGNTAEASAATAKRVSGAVQTTPLNTQWAIPLNSPDVGARKITNVALSVAGASGATDWILGHSLVSMPMPVASLVMPADGINSAFNLVQIVDSACLAFAEFSKSATTLSVVQAEDLTLVSG